MRSAAALFLGGLWAASCALAAPVVIVRDGRPTVRIVLPEKPSKTVLFAAGELQRYIESISGAKVPIAPEIKPGNGLEMHVGPTSTARNLMPGRIAGAPEGIFVRVDPARVILCGGSDRGTLYAVYRFLEQCLGCRWLAPDVEHIPRRTTLTVQSLSIAEVPAFDLRLFVARIPNLRAWGMKIGMNGFYTRDDVAVTGGGYYLPKEVSGCHAYSRIIPSEKYFESHPEWFPLIEGKRVPTTPHGPQLCLTAPGLADEFARNVVRLFDDDPDLKIVSISPNDDRGWCECAACRALDEKLCGSRTTNQGLAEERPFRGDRVFWFANQAARRVAKKHPTAMLLELAYINYAEPPDSVTPAPNVIPWLCHYAPADYSRAINDPDSLPNRQFNQLLRRWVKVAPRLLFYSYVSKSMWWRLPRPVMHNFAADIKYLHSLGVHRYYCQSTLRDWPLDGPLYYVIAKLLWDPSQDPDAIAADWIRHMFGPAAPAMTEFYRAVEQAVRNTGKPYSDNPPRDVPGLYDPPELERALQLLDRAAELARKDPATAERVKKVADVFRYGFHMIRCIEAARAFRAHHTRANMHKALDEGRRALSYCHVREARKFVDNLRMNDELGVLARGFSEPLRLGGRRCWNTDETGPGDGKAGWATVYIETPDTSKPVVVGMDVWGESDLNAIVVNTGGLGRSYANGGIWKPVPPAQPLSGRKQWEKVVFVIPPEVMAKGKKVQTIGMGGGDSQIWIAKVRVTGTGKKDE